MHRPRKPRDPKYRWHKASNQAIVTLSGRMFYLGRYGTPESEELYHRLLGEWIASGRTRPPQTADPESEPSLTVDELILAYYGHCTTYYTKAGRPTSQLHRIRHALRVLRRLYGSSPVRDFGPLALEACRAMFIEQGLCRRECNRRTRLITQAFRWAVAKELAPPSLHHALKAVAGLARGRCDAPDHAPVGPVPEAIVEKTLEFLGRTVGDMVCLQSLTGMRSGELVIMRACDINMSGPVWEYRPSSYKTEHHEQGTARIIMIGPQGQVVIRRWLVPDTQAFLFSPQRAESEHTERRRAARRTPLWPGHLKYQDRQRRARRRKVLGDRHDTKGYCRAITRACDRAFPHPELSRIPPKERTAEQKAEIKAWQRAHQWHPHRLRHSAATAIRRQFGVEAAQVVLGHSQIDTSELYAQQNLDAARDVMARIG
jgi:integrase